MLSNVARVPLNPGSIALLPIVNLYFERIQQLIQRVQSYPPQEVLVELAVLWAVVYLVLRVIRGTRGAKVIKGVALILIIATLTVRVLGRSDSAEAGSFERLTFLYNNFLSAVAVVLVVIFAPELRRGLVRLGDLGWFAGGSMRRGKVLDELLASVAYLSQNKIGALIAIERQVGLDGIVETATPVDALVTKELLNTIFWPGSALHDMGVVIRGDRLALAAAQFPLAEGESFGTELGSRHRAAVGLSQEADALVIVVSEETGTISLAEGGILARHLSLDDLATTLARRFGQSRASRKAAPVTSTAKPLSSDKKSDDKNSDEKNTDGKSPDEKKSDDKIVAA